jgi:hypothetical protein
MTGFWCLSYCVSDPMAAVVETMSCLARLLMVAAMIWGKVTALRINRSQVTNATEYHKELLGMQPADRCHSLIRVAIAQRE